MSGQRERELRVLLHQDDGGPLVGGHAPDRARQLLGDDRREPLERLVEQEQRRIGHQRPRDGQHLLLAAREVAAHAVAPRRERRKEVVDGPQVPSARPCGDRQVLLDRQRGEDLALLRHPAQSPEGAAVGRRRGDLGAAPRDRAAADVRVAHDGQEERGLADPVAPEHRQTASLGEIERHVVEHDRLAVAGSHVPQREQRLSHGALRRDRSPARAGRRRSRTACPRRGSGRRPSR